MATNSTTLASEPVSGAHTKAEPFGSISTLDNGELIQRLEQLNQRKRVLDAELLLHLSLFEHRGLYRDFESSMFTYCVNRLGFSEDVAYKRVAVARMLRDFPAIYELLTKGKIHLSALLLLKPIMTEENQTELLRSACGLSKRAVERLVATRQPRPAVSASVRKLPEPRFVPSRWSSIELSEAPADLQAVGLSEVPVGVSLPPMATPSSAPWNSAHTDAPYAVTLDSLPAAAAPSCLMVETKSDNSEREPRPQARTTQSPCCGMARPGRSKVEALSSCTYRVVFTASESLKQKLDRARELASHAVSPADLPGLLERALDLLIEKEEKRRFARTSRGSIQVRVPQKLVVEGKSRHVGRLPNSGQDGDPLVLKPTEAQGGARRLAPEKGSACPIAPGRTGAHPLIATDGSAHPLIATDGGARPPDAAPCRERPRPSEDGGTMRQKSYSRSIPASVRREVWVRDQGRCAFVDGEGHRCEERHFVQFEHKIPYALRGLATTENCELLCATHNALRAERIFGRAKIASKVAARSADRRAGDSPIGDGRAGNSASP